MKIVAYIDNERVVFDSDNDRDYSYKEIQTDIGDFIIFESSEAAGEAAREYWEDMAYNDPQEFTCLVGEKTLVAWALGQYAGPGYTQVQSLDEWLDLWLDTPEEQFASYDGIECKFRCKHPDYDIYEVAYRTN